MAKYISNRQQNLKIGIVSYTENETVLEVTGGTYVSGSVGIGSTTPTSKLTVQGDVLVSGILTASHIVGTSLSISGISTLGGNVNVGTGITMYSSTGIISATAFYGNGENLTEIVKSKLAGITVLDENTLVGTEFQFSQLKFVGSYVTATGIGSTASITFTDPENVIGGIASVTSLNVSGITTLGVTSTTNLTSQQLLVTGITTLASVVGTSLSISGISTIGNLTITPVGTGATVGGVGIVTYHGDGSKLTGIISGLGGIGTAGGTVGTGITFLDFRGSGISSVTASAGIATITIPGASRSVKSYVVTEEGQTTFAATYSIGYADVYLNGSKLSSPEDITSVSPPEYTASNGTSIELTQGASLGDIVEIVSYFINIVDTNISPVMMGMIF